MPKIVHLNNNEEVVEDYSVVNTKASHKVRCSAKM